MFTIEQQEAIKGIPRGMTDSKKIVEAYAINFADNRTKRFGKFLYAYIWAIVCIGVLKILYDLKTKTKFRIWNRFVLIILSLEGILGTIFMKELTRFCAKTRARLAGEIFEKIIVTEYNSN